MRKASYRDANHYKARADECRAIAEQFLKGDAHITMLRVATSYERMADSADRIAGVVDELDELTPAHSNGRKFHSLI
jgi:formate-dependent phosphoribosylglycinamide formyltransferase (GAR transformylase)